MRRNILWLIITQRSGRNRVSGKTFIPLPMYVNAHWNSTPDRPGCYPSGGPVGKLIPLWKKAAPSLDLIAPDIYLPDLKGVCEEYSVCGNTLFIPRREEIRLLHPMPFMLWAE